MKSQTARQFKALLAAGRWFGGLPEPFQDSLLAAADLRTLAPGERLFARGDPPDGLYAVVDGALRVSGLGEDGKEALLTLAEPPGWFGEVSLFDGLPRTHDAVANVETRVVHVPQGALLEILEREPRWWRHLGSLVASKLRLAFIAMEDNALLPIAVRLARRLLLMAEAYGEWTDRSRTAVTVKQEQLAGMLGTSRQTVNQVLKDMEGKGLVKLSYGEIGIIDFNGLRRVASA